VAKSKISANQSNKSDGKSMTSGGESFRYAPSVCELSESLGGGPEYLPVWRPPLWPFRLVGWFEQEED
jgi:hypothetical protein